VELRAVLFSLYPNEKMQGLLELTFYIAALYADDDSNIIPRFIIYSIKEEDILYRILWPPKNKNLHIPTRSTLNIICTQC